MYEAALAVAAADRLQTIRRHFRAMLDVFGQNRRQNAQLLLAVRHFGVGLAKQTFDAWRRLLLQSKAWFLQGDKAHMQHAFRQFQKQSKGMGKFGAAWREAAGLDIVKQVRRAFTRMLSHAAATGAMRAAVGYWRQAKIRTCLLKWSETVREGQRRLQLLRRSLSHHSNVLLQAVLKEWYIAVRHDVLARNAWARSSVILGFVKWRKDRVRTEMLLHVLHALGVVRWVQ